MIPLRTYDTPHYEARYTLDGKTYAFSFAHNERLDRWYVGITDDTGKVVYCTNRKLVCGQDLLQGVTAEGRPPKPVYVVALADGDAPGLTGLAEVGGTYTLVYDA